jgi:hypothetical protein
MTEDEAAFLVDLGLRSGCFVRPAACLRTGWKRRQTSLG